MSHLMITLLCKVVSPDGGRQLRSRNPNGIRLRSRIGVLWPKSAEEPKGSRLVGVYIYIHTHITVRVTCRYIYYLCSADTERAREKNSRESWEESSVSVAEKEKRQRRVECCGWAWEEARQESEREVKKRVRAEKSLQSRASKEVDANMLGFGR